MAARMGGEAAGGEHIRVCQYARVNGGPWERSQVSPQRPVERRIRMFSSRRKRTVTPWNEHFVTVLRREDN